MRKLVVLLGLGVIVPSLCLAHQNHWRMQDEGYKALYRGAERLTISVCVDSIQTPSAKVSVDGRSPGSSVSPIRLSAGECATVHGQVVTLKSGFSHIKTLTAEGRYEIIR